MSNRIDDSNLRSLKVSSECLQSPDNFWWNQVEQILGSFDAPFTTRLLSSRHAAATTAIALTTNLRSDAAYRHLRYMYSWTFLVDIANIGTEYSSAHFSQRINKHPQKVQKSIKKVSFKRLLRVETTNNIHLQYRVSNEFMSKLKSSVWYLVWNMSHPVLKASHVTFSSFDIWPPKSATQITSEKRCEKSISRPLRRAASKTGWNHKEVEVGQQMQQSNLI